MDKAYGDTEAKRIQRILCSTFFLHFKMLHHSYPIGRLMLESSSLVIYYKEYALSLFGL